jgi:glycine oxidase
MAVDTHDVVIVGGGVIGLSIARELHKKGAGRIAVIERGTCGQEASWAAAGMLSPQAEADEPGVFLDLSIASRDLYPDFSAQLLDETGIDIELARYGTLSLAFSDERAQVVLDRYRWQSAMGLRVEILRPEEFLKMEPEISAVAQFAVSYPNDRQVENRKLLQALRRYMELNGIDLVENTAVEAVLVEGDNALGVETASGSIYAGSVVLATGAWTSLVKLGTMPVPLKVRPVRGQMLCFAGRPGVFESVIYGNRGYIVPRLDGRILAGSTSEDVGFDRSTTEAAASALREAAIEIAPYFSTLPIVDHWAGLRPAASDDLPVIGAYTGVDGLHIATAHYRNGILLAPLTAHLIAQSIIDDVRSPFLSTFGPDRFGVEAASVASQL